MGENLNQPWSHEDFKCYVVLEVDGGKTSNLQGLGAGSVFGRVFVYLQNCDSKKVNHHHQSWNKPTLAGGVTHTHVLIEVNRGTGAERSPEESYKEGLGLTQHETHPSSIAQVL